MGGGERMAWKDFLDIVKVGFGIIVDHHIEAGEGL
jgi:hypothetical protein